MVSFTNGNSSLVVHNIGGGAKEEDVLRNGEIIAHIRVNEDLLR
ncbi:MAG: DUF1287 domain-containing protein [Deferribacteraceae bacterium]|nr:DUF1287 domain-containing protein [Deferribacteraceae bacterium]